MAFELPYMPMWVIDLDTDRDCRAMGDAEIGRYMRLLFRQWIEGDVPANAKAAIRDAMLDAGSEASVQKLLDLKFTERVGARARNPKCHELREAALAKVKVNRMNGKKGGRPKRKETQRLSEPEPIPESDPESEKLHPGASAPAPSGGEPVQADQQAADIAWSKSQGWRGITDYDRARWKQAYPACDIDRQLAAMNEWLLGNPTKAVKKNYRRFITNWLSKSQEKGGDERSNGTRAGGATQTRQGRDDWRERKQAREHPHDEAPPASI